MEARYALHKSQLLEECQVAPAIFEHVIPRLYPFMAPVVTIFHGEAPINTPNSLSVACCRMSNGKTSHRLPIVLASLACRCKALLGGTRGTMRPCERR